MAKPCTNNSKESECKYLNKGVGKATHYHKKNIRQGNKIEQIN
jgi:hypothetical protein